MKLLSTCTCAGTSIDIASSFNLDLAVTCPVEVVHRFANDPRELERTGFWSIELVQYIES
jgi:hypothetical protein